MAVPGDKINITIDQDALRAQVEEVLNEVLESFARNLLWAAHSVSPSDLAEVHKYDYDRGFQAGKESKDAE